MAAPTVRSSVRSVGDHDGIVTPEAVLLELPSAGLGSRALAFAVDLGVRAALALGALVALGPVGLVDETAAVVGSIAVVFAALLVYPVLCETLWRGRTPGKAALGLRVVTLEGAPVRFRHAAIRSALGIVDFVVTAGAGAVLAALGTRRAQRLGDLAAGTVVIRDRQARTDSQPVAFHPPPGWEAWARAIDVSRLDDETYVLVRTLLLRRRDLRPDVLATRGAALAERVAARVGLAFPPGTDAEAWLVSVAAAHQARTAGAEPTTPVAPPPAVAAPPPVADRRAPAAPGVAPAAPPPVRSRLAPDPVIDVDEPPDTWGRPG